jgi:hypothetical protein
MSSRQVRLTINGREYSGDVEPRKLLTDFCPVGAISLKIMVLVIGVMILFDAIIITRLNNNECKTKKGITSDFYKAHAFNDCVERD